MVIYYFDTSALLKQYLYETGSQWIQQTLSRVETVMVTAQLAMVEIGSALNRRVRAGTVTVDEYYLLLNQFEHDCRTKYTLVNLADNLITMCWRLLD